MNIEGYVRDVAKQLNKKYRGIISKSKVDDFIHELSSLQCSDDEIIGIVENMKNRAIDSYTKYIRFNEPFVEEKKFELNDLFSCSITNDVLHIHVVPVSVKNDIARMGGHNRYFSYVEDRLFEAFGKIATIISSDDNSNVTEIYAVSKLLKMGKVQSMFRDSGFDVGLTNNDLLQERFGTANLYEAVISRENFLSLYGKESVGENMNDNVTSNFDGNSNGVSELDEMFFNGQEPVSQSGLEEQKAEGKVLIKTSNEVGTGNKAGIGSAMNLSSSGSDEGGYGTVLGVVMVIVSISFILAALFIRMMI